MASLDQSNFGRFYPLIKSVGGFIRLLAFAFKSHFCTLAKGSENSIVKTKNTDKKFVSKNLKYFKLQL